MPKILVTGGSGFIGSAVCRHLVNDLNFEVVNVDKLTYAANSESLENIADSPNYKFVQEDICQSAAMLEIMRNHQIDGVMHLAAESHVDRSIDSPGQFIQTNVVGTYALLEAARHYWSELKGDNHQHFRFHHVSTDEVFGDLEFDDSKFSEESPYKPSSPYSASKAAADHLVRAWHHTFALPVVLSNCSNNYGPWQFPEKLIPLMILNAYHGKPLPIYGDGQNIRDWLHVEDHAEALALVLTKGEVGRTYAIGGNAERSNLAVVHLICDLVDQTGAKHNKPCRELITQVKDRLGHDRRYAIDASRIHRELGWAPRHSFEIGMGETIAWYLDREKRKHNT